MKCVAVFSDIHGNLEALLAVLADAERQRATDHVCIGDIVGYNASPRECVGIVRALGCPVVQGNCDEQAAMTDKLAGFHPLAREVIEWTRRQLDEDDKRWLRELPLVRIANGFTAVHATLDVPHKWGYVFNALDAAASFRSQETDLCFFGHTHAPRAFIHDGAVRMQALDKLAIAPGTRYFINVGSVGQPRDGDWRAAYCLYRPAEGTVELRRVEYDIGEAQAKIAGAGLPTRPR